MPKPVRVPNLAEEDPDVMSDDPRVARRALEEFFRGTGGAPKGGRSVRKSGRVPASTQSPKEGNMATKVKRGGGKAASTKKSGGTTATKKSGANGSAETAAQRKRGELAAKLAKEAGAIAKRLKAGGKMKAEKERYGLSADTAIIKALAHAGFTSKGDKLEVEEIDVSKAAGKKALVKARKDGISWIILEIATGKGEAELRKIVEEAGGPTGRVYKNAGGSAGR